MVNKFLNRLPRNKYIQLVASLEQVLDLNTTGFEDIVGRLKAYEERIREEGHGDDQGNLLFTSYDTQSTRGGFSGFQGRGHGRGRGRRRFNTQHHPNNAKEQDQAKEKPKKDRSKVICWSCDKPGHFASSCPEKAQRGQETNLVETEEADAALYKHEVVFLNEKNIIPRKYEEEKDELSIWYLDNGASNHMTGNRSFFSELNEKITGKVKFGDESCVEIKGKGSIILQAKTGEQRLISDVYFIPDLKSNIISLGQATENGCDVRLKDNYLTIHDYNGRFLMKVIRSPNRMYKISLMVGIPSYSRTKGEDGNSGITMFWGKSIDNGTRPYITEEEPLDGSNRENKENKKVAGTRDELFQQPDELIFRRSNRETSRPKYLEDFVLLTDIEGEELLLSINGESNSYQEAQDSREWMKSMKSKIESIKATWFQDLLHEITTEIEELRVADSKARHEMVRETNMSYVKKKKEETLEVLKHLVKRLPLAVTEKKEAILMEEEKLIGVEDLSNSSLGIMGDNVG